MFSIAAACVKYLGLKILCACQFELFIFRVINFSAKHAKGSF